MELREKAAEMLGSQEEGDKMIAVSEEISKKVMEVVEGILNEYTDESGDTEMTAAMGVLSGMGEVLCMLIGALPKEQREPMLKTWTKSLALSVKIVGQKMDNEALN
jgi:hypothetical protein